MPGHSLSLKTSSTAEAGMDDVSAGAGEAQRRRGWGLLPNRGQQPQPPRQRQSYP